jgi:hypothetical protein
MAADAGAATRYSRDAGRPAGGLESPQIELAFLRGAAGTRNPRRGRLRHSKLEPGPVMRRSAQMWDVGLESPQIELAFLRGAAINTFASRWKSPDVPTLGTAFINKIFLRIFSVDRLVRMDGYFAPFAAISNAHPLRSRPRWTPADPRRLASRPLLGPPPRPRRRPTLWQ